MRATTKLTLVFLVVALTSGALTTTLLAATGGDDPNVVTADAASAPVRAVPPELAGLMHVFDRAQVSSDVIPGDPAATLERLDDLQPGENPLLARRVRLATDLDGFVWPMSNGVCYSSPGPSGCYPTHLLRKSGVLVGVEFSGDSQRVRVFGIASDGVRKRLGLEPLVFTDPEIERVEELVDVGRRDPPLTALVGDLPEDQRAAVLARVVDEREYRDIAAQEGVSEGAVRQRVSRGLARLAHQTRGDDHV